MVVRRSLHRNTGSTRLSLSSAMMDIASMALPAGRACHQEAGLEGKPLIVKVSTRVVEEESS